MQRKTVEQEQSKMEAAGSTAGRGTRLLPLSNLLLVVVCLMWACICFLNRFLLLCYALHFFLLSISILFSFYASLSLMLDICPSHKSSWPKYDSHAQCLLQWLTNPSVFFIFVFLFSFFRCTPVLFLNSTFTLEFSDDEKLIIYVVIVWFAHQKRKAIRCSLQIRSLLIM